MSLLPSAVPVAARQVAARLAVLPPIASSFRTYASSSAPAAAAPAPDQTATPAAVAPSSSKSTLPPSSCPAGTPMPGLSLLKDRPEVIALPDEEYPPWLWNLLGDAAIKTTHASVEGEGAGAGTSGAASSGSVAQTKGELRVKQKRELKEKRQAEAKAAAQAARAASRAAASGKLPPVGSAEALAAQADIAVADGQGAAASTPADREQREAKQRKELRKANREAIRSRNFLGR